MSLVSANDILEPIYKALYNNAVLSGNNYLGGFNRVIKGPRKTDNDKFAYYVTMNVLTSTVKSESKVQDMIVQVVGHASDIGGAADTARLSRIMDQVAELIDDVSLDYNSNVKRGHNFIIEGAIGPLWDSERQEHYMSIRFRFLIIDNT